MGHQGRNRFLNNGGDTHLDILLKITPQFMVYGPFYLLLILCCPWKATDAYSLSLQIKPNMHYFLLFSTKSYLRVVLWKICPGNIYLFEGRERGGGEDICYQVTKCIKPEKDFYVYFQLKDWNLIIFNWGLSTNAFCAILLQESRIKRF